MGFSRDSRQLRCSSEGAGAARRLFDGADTTGEISFTSVRPRRKQNRRILFTFGMSCPGDHRKRQSERRAARSGIYRAKRLHPLRSPVSQSISRVSRQSAMVRNRYILENCDEAVFASIDPNGSLNGLVAESPSLKYNIL